MAGDESEAHLPTEIVAACCVGSALSILSFIAILVSFSRHPVLRQHPHSLVFWRTVCDVVFVLSLLVSTVVGDEDRSQSDCVELAVLIQMFGFAAQGWYAVTIVDLLFSFRNPFYTSQNYHTTYHVVVWSLSVACGTVMVASNSYGVSDLGMCWIKTQGDGPNPWKWILFFLPTLVVFFSSLIVATYVSYNLSNTASTSYSTSTRKRTLHFSRVYVIVFGIYWGVLAVLYFVGYLDSFSVHGVTAAVVFGLSIRGVVDGFIWFRFHLVAQTTSSRSHELEQLEEDKQQDIDFQKALRTDVMHATCHGIMTSICQNLVRPVLHPMPAAAMQAKNVLSHTWVSPYSKETSQYAFTDHCPEVFHALRTAWGYDTPTYLQSFGQRENGTWVVRRMIEKASKGRSGAFFYFSHDRRFIIKTLSATESNTLRRIIPDYYEYMMAHPHSLLTRYFGCHSVRIHSKVLHFVSIDNLFQHHDVQEVYDLKGSWVDRQAVKVVSPRSSVLRKRSSERGTPEQVVKGGVMKDTDLLSREQWLVVGGERGQRLMQQLLSDSQFLAGCGIMDYSLLVGFHDSSRGVQGDAAARRSNGNQSGGSQPNRPVSLPLATRRSGSQEDHGNGEGQPAPPAKEGAEQAPEGDGEEGEDADEGQREERVLQGPNGVRLPASVSLPPSVLEARLRESELEMAEHKRSASVPSRPSSAPSGETHACCEFRQDEGGVYSGLEGKKWTGTGSGQIYYLGIIDTLQEWTFQKIGERWLKTLILRKDKDGVSAIPPEPYAARFGKFVQRIVRFEVPNHHQP